MGLCQYSWLPLKWGHVFLQFLSFFVLSLTSYVKENLRVYSSFLFIMSTKGKILANNCIDGILNICLYVPEIRQVFNTER